MSYVKSISYKPRAEAASGQGYVRRVVSEAMLLENFGIEGDRKGGHPHRNLNVMDEPTLSELESEGYPVNPGVLGENIVICGIDLRRVPEGTILRLGDEAEIAVGELRVPCEQLSEIDARMPAEVLGRVGTMCRVVRSGRVEVGDPVSIVTQLANMDDVVKICPDEP